MRVPAIRILRPPEMHWSFQIDRSAVRQAKKRTCFLVVGLLLVLVLVGVELGRTGTGMLPRLTSIPVGLLLLGVVTCDAIESSLRVLNRERRNLRAERRAFEQFSREVQRIPVPAGDTGGGRPIQLQATDRSSEPLWMVRDRYQETVMSVPDYDSAYGESLEEHFSAELGPDLASILLDANRFTPAVKRQIAQQADQCIRERQPLLDGIDCEEDSLRAARSELLQVAEALSEIHLDELVDAKEVDLNATKDRVGELLARTERTMEARQRDIKRINGKLSGETNVFIQEYLYQRKDIIYPVLDCAVTYTQALEQNRALITQILEYR